MTDDPRVERIVAIGFLEDWAVRSIRAFEAAGLIVLVPDDAESMLRELLMTWFKDNHEPWLTPEYFAENIASDILTVLSAANPIGLVEGG